jgi:hypothetical protein
MSLGDEALVLRQVAALRERGVSAHEALVLAAEGVPSGPLRVRLEEARRALAAGSTGGFAGPPAALEQAASAIEARIDAEDALRTTRAYASVAIALPLVVGALWGSILSTGAGSEWMDAGGDGGPLPVSAVAAAILARVICVAGVPLAVGGVLAIRRITPRFAPGAALLAQAAALLDGVTPPDLSPADLRYLDTRRPDAGPAAAVELAEELAREGRYRRDVFRHAAPVLGAVILLPAVLLGMAVLTAPIFATIVSIP